MANPENSNKVIKMIESSLCSLVKSKFELDPVLAEYLEATLKESTEEDEFNELIESIVETVIAYQPGLESVQRSRLISAIAELRCRLKEVPEPGNKEKQMDETGVSQLDQKVTAIDLGHNFTPVPNLQERPSARNKCSNLKTKSQKCEDDSVKEKILAKHSMVAEGCSSRGRTEIPFDERCLSKGEPKTKQRYLDGRPVNTKGQKYLVVAEENTEEMKKTYINLKPARQYRFH